MTQKTEANFKQLRQSSELK